MLKESIRISHIISNLKTVESVYSFFCLSLNSKYPICLALQCFVDWFRGQLIGWRHFPHRIDPALVWPEWCWKEKRKAKNTYPKVSLNCKQMRRRISKVRVIKMGKHTIVDFILQKSFHLTILMWLSLETGIRFL